MYPREGHSKLSLFTYIIMGGCPISYMNCYPIIQVQSLSMLVCLISRVSFVYLVPRLLPLYLVTVVPDLLLSSYQLSDSWLWLLIVVCQLQNYIHYWQESVGDR